MSDKGSLSEEEKDKFICSICEQSFLCNKEYNNHMKNHNKVLKCDVCLKPFSNEKCRRRHYYEMHSDAMLKCTSCDIRYNKFTDINLHKKFHTKEFPYLCLLCLKSYKNLKALRKHHGMHEREAKKAISIKKIFDDDSSGPNNDIDDDANLQASALKAEAKLTQEGFMCEVCGKSFTLYRNFERHILTHEPKGSYKCNLCDRVFELKLKLQEHIRYHRKRKSLKPYVGRPESDPKIDPFIKTRPLCHTCGKSFCDSRHLRRHREFHLPKGHFPCKLCDKSFDLNIKLKFHMVWHRRKARFSSDPSSGKMGTFPCEYCGKVFFYPTSLNSHRQLHVESHNCNLCGKTFNKKWNLKTHMSIHLGNKPYSCSYCGASYADRSNLKKHLMKHPSDVGAKTIVNKKPLISSPTPSITSA